MKIILLLVTFIFIFLGNNAKASCNVTFSSDNTPTSNMVCADDDTLTVNEGVTLTLDANYRIDTRGSGSGHGQTPVGDGADNFTLINNGTIVANNFKTTHITDSTNASITNNGTWTTAFGELIILDGHRDDLTLTNKGTINSDQHAAISNYDSGANGTITINNSGVITGGGLNNTSHNPSWIGVINLGHCVASRVGEGGNFRYCTEANTTGNGSNIIDNSGRIEANNHGVFAIRFNNTVDNTVTNTGSIFGGNEQAVTVGSSGVGRRIGMDIKVDKCSSTDGRNACGASGNGTTTINIGGDAKFRNGIDFNATNGVIVIRSDLKRDIELNIFDYTDGDGGTELLTITNNSDHEVTFLKDQTLTFSTGATNAYGSITNSRKAESGNQVNRTKVHTGLGDNEINEAAEYYDGGDDGILIIKGERLELSQNSHKYRAENTPSKFRNFYNASNHIGFNKQRCTTLDEIVKNKEFKDCNTGFAKMFHSVQRREDVYQGENYGGVGMYSPIILTDNTVSNIFIGYSKQESNFNDKTNSYNDNFTLGLKNTYQDANLKASLTPIIGLSLQEQTDYDTDKTEVRTENFLSQFAGLNLKLENNINNNADNFFTLGVESSYSVQKYPEYSSHFTDGILLVKSSVDQILANTLELSHTTKKTSGNMSKFYFGGSVFKNYNDKIKVTARGFNSDVNNEGNQNWSGFHLGYTVGKRALENNDFNYEFDLRYENQEGLIDKTARFTVNKTF